MLAMENKWSVSGAGRKLGDRERSGGHRKRWGVRERGGAGGCGAGTERRF